MVKEKWSPNQAPLTKRQKFKSELDGLRNIKKDQKKTMHDVLENKNFPEKMHDLREGIDKLKLEKKE